MVICQCVSCRIPVVLITAGRNGGTSSYDCYVSMVQICLASKHKDSQQWQNDSLVSRSWFGCVHCAKTEGGGLGRANTNQDDPIVTITQHNSVKFIPQPFTYKTMQYCHALSFACPIACTNQ